MTGSAKTRHNSTFFILLHFYNLVCAGRVFKFLKLQPYIVAAIERSICTVKYRENKLQALTKTDVTYKWSDVQTQSLYHRVCHELCNGLLGKLFFLLFNVTSSRDMIFCQMQQLQCLYHGCTKFVLHYGFSTRLG